MNFNEFADSLSQYDDRDILFIGLGNELRGDDAISFYFIENLKTTAKFSHSHYLSVGTNPENYLSKIVNFESDLIVFIDAARTDMKPGTISWLNKEVINNINISTHAFSIKLVEQFILQQRNIEIKYLGIEPKDTDFGSELSVELIQSVDLFFNNLKR